MGHKILQSVDAVEMECIPLLMGQEAVSPRMQSREPHLVLDGEIDEVGVHNDLVGGPQLRVVLEEQGRRSLLPAK
jgi:hypothetical protein